MADTLESSSSNKHLEGLTYSWLPVNNPWLLSNCFWRSSLRYGEAKKKLCTRTLDNILRNRDHLCVSMNNELGSGLQRLSVSTSTCKHESTRPKEHFTLLCLLPSISQRFLLINAPIICLLQLSFTFLWLSRLLLYQDHASRADVTYLRDLALVFTFFFLLRSRFSQSGRLRGRNHSYIRTHISLLTNNPSIHNVIAAGEQPCRTKLMVLLPFR